MKGDLRSSEPDRLSEVLRTWTSRPSLSPGFPREVWRRIRDGRQPAFRTLISAWWEWAAGQLRHPRIAFAYLSLFLLIGAGAGTWRGQEGSAALAEGLRDRYLQSIDPFNIGGP